MPVLIRFTINDHGIGGADFDAIARALATQGLPDPTDYPHFRVYADSQYPKSTVVEYTKHEDFATALGAVKRAIAAAGIERYCTGGDLHLPTEAVGLTP
jgi:hypothetical protein